MATLEIKVPDIGDFTDVSVIELLVKPGDTVQAEQSLLTVESDKASMEIPSSHAGVVRQLLVALGDKVRQGSSLLLLDVADEASAPVIPVAMASPQESGEKPAPALAGTALPATQTVATEAIEVRVPDIGDFKDVSVIEVMVKVGDTVRLEQSLITVESDKASMEIPSNAAGIITEVKVKLGDKINIGDLLAMLQGSKTPAVAATLLADQKAAPVSDQKPAPALASQALTAPSSVADQAPSVAVPTHQPGALTMGLPHASPSVRKFARELGVPLAEVKGSGLKGRIIDPDVQSFTRSVMSGALQTLAIAAQQAAKPAAAAGTAAVASTSAGLGLIPWPKVDFAKFGPIERKELSRIKKISAANLLRNAILIPAVTNHDDADITDLEAFRIATNQENDKGGIKVTMLAFLIKACVAALKKFPDFNSSLDAESDNSALIYKQYYHIGFAADTPNGLMVPVIKDANKKGIFQISLEMGELAKKAREGKLSPTEMTGACFTISSLGGIGGRYFTPIINAPEVAI
jgi:pyruvate dehydrogenase E2 component (dihydrolipoamide acetyltransferase)